MVTICQRLPERKKVPANSDFFLFSTLDRFSRLVKIKFVENKTLSSGRGFSRRTKSVDIRPYHLRVQRDHGGGLWTAEDEDGQLYLMVRSREINASVQQLDEARAADGSRYRGK